MADSNEELSSNFDELNIRECSTPEYISRSVSSIPNICKYFSNFGNCKYGDGCKYLHKSRVPEGIGRPKKQYSGEKWKNNNKSDFDNQKMVTYKKYVLNSNKESSLTLFDNQQTVKNCQNKDRTFRKRALCHFYKRGKCMNGDNCKYYHQNKNPNFDKNSNLKVQVTSCSKSENVSSEPLQINDSIKTKQQIKVVKLPSNVQDLTKATEENIVHLRTTEINQLKKRFPHAEELLGNEKFSVIFEPSDPDWPFDLRKIKVEVSFPARYPLEECSISVIKDAENIPQLLIRFLNKAILDWITQRYVENNGKLELIFRPFLKWFDRHLEDLFISGLRKVKQDLKAKEDGIEFVAPEDIFSSLKENIISESSKEKDDITEDKSSELQSSQSQGQPASKMPLSQNKELQYIGNNITKVILSDLELLESAAALTCTKISLTLQCCRCKFSVHMKSIPKKHNTTFCSKCSKGVGFMWESNTIHQFSSVVGNLYLLDCVALDMNLVESLFLIDCLNCSKQVPVDSIHYGQKQKMWCIFCNAKMMITIGSVKFQTIKLASVSETKNFPIKKSDKKIKDPVIKEGSPLPDYGACKHYKKSFRWLRFPCCGRLYACDECHNEKETDHEMKFASRMVCGYCSKEQPYSKEKPCYLCSQNLTKKSGAHWEDGKGCRNKVKMSRLDKQKYAGICKTVSKKAQSSKS